MTRPRKKKASGICSIYRELLQRLPHTYPKPSLIVHPTLTDLYDYYWSDDPEEDEDDPGHSPYAFCVFDGKDYSIHISASSNKVSRESIIWYYLHEMGHLYAVTRYGIDDKRWSNYKEAERYANRFASRWINRLKKEGWI